MFPYEHVKTSGNNSVENEFGQKRLRVNATLNVMSNVLFSTMAVSFPHPSDYVFALAAVVTVSLTIMNAINAAFIRGWLL